MMYICSSSCFANVSTFVTFYKPFTSKQTHDTYDKYDIIHSPVIARDDHRALGILDRFAFTLKL